MIIKDDRTDAQRKSHTWLIVGTDRFLSGWGRAKNGLSYAAWACLPEDRKYVFDWVEARSDMLRVREASDTYRPYRPKGRGQLYIYVVEPDHPALAAKARMARRA